ncbi:protein of unknown function [Rhodovastum atsumiense]|nr:protein of unknown function [Rhodovastum atsumiense]
MNEAQPVVALPEPHCAKAFVDLPGYFILLRYRHMIRTESSSHRHRNKTVAFPRICKYAFALS